MRFLQKIRKMIAVIGMIAFSIFTLAVVHAQVTTSDPFTNPPTNDGNETSATIIALLREIKDNTYQTLVQVNNLPVYLAKLDEYLRSWLAADESESAAQMKVAFTEYGANSVQAKATVGALQQQLLLDLFNRATSETLPTANDLAYQTLLGMPYFTEDTRRPPVNSPYEYIKHASGMSIYHRVPDVSWSGREQERVRYYGMFNTIMAATSFGAYALSDLYADFLNQNRLSKMQDVLYAQATNEQWFVDVAGTESLGTIFRQMLMFQSQTFVLLTQLLEVEKKLLTAQVMTNSLLTVVNQINENALADRASGVTATP